MHPYHPLALFMGCGVVERHLEMAQPTKNQTKCTLPPTIPPQTHAAVKAWKFRSIPSICSKVIHEIVLHIRTDGQSHRRTDGRTHKLDTKQITPLPYMGTVEIFSASFFLPLTKAISLFQYSVSRFGKIWHNIKTLWPFWKCSFNIWAYFGKVVMRLSNFDV